MDEVNPVGSGPHHRRDAVHGVGDAVHVADLVPVIRGDGHLDDLLLSGQELDDDLCVEMEIVGVVLERNLSQHRDAIGSVSRVELSQICVEEAVLDCREDPVPQALVQWHASAPGGSPRHHARAEDGGGVGVRERAQNPGEDLGSILSIAMEEHQNVEPSANRVAEAELLVSPVPLVERGGE